LAVWLRAALQLGELTTLSQLRNWIKTWVGTPGEEQGVGRKRRGVEGKGERGMRG